MFYRILSDPLAILMVVLFFGASIFIHELGHYMAARWRKLKIDRFSIGFGPRLFGWKDKQGVDWRVSLIPLGGYVALPQLADMRGIEGSPTQDAEELPPLSYSDKMIVSVAGAVYNVIFALAIGTMLWVTGVPVSSQMESTQIGYISESITDENGTERPGPAARAGLKEGDTIISIDGKRIRDWEDILYGVTTGTGRSEYGNPLSKFTVERAGEQLDFDVFPLLDEEEGIRRIGIAPANPLIVGDVMENSPAALAGLQAEDEITGVNDIPLFHTARLSSLIRETPDTQLNLEVKRAGETRQFTMKPEQVVYNTDGDTTPMIGVSWYFPEVMVHKSPFKQIGEAFTTTFRVLGALIHPQSDIGFRNLSGPVGISYTLYIFSQIGILEVLSIVVLININLAILNLLPIPVLDGGHMAFATIAKLRKKPVSPTIMASAQGAFMLFFLAIFVYVTFFDIGRVGRNESAISAQEEAANKRIPIVFKGESETSEINPES